MIKKLAFGSALLTLLMSLQACAPPQPPPRDAKAISETEFKDEIKTGPALPAAGGGKSLKKNEW